MLKSFYAANNHQYEETPAEQEKIFARYVSENGLMFKLYN
jgi:hypothetical protein